MTFCMPGDHPGTCSTAPLGMFRPYLVTTTLGTRTIVARTLAEAIRHGLELTGPGARLLSCLLEGEW